MKLLVDADIYFRIVKQLHFSAFEKIIHVTRTGLLIPSKDTHIWKWAKENNFMIVTNDEDFENLLMKNGFPPKIILLKTGNQQTKFLASVLNKHIKDIEKMYFSE